MTIPFKLSFIARKDYPSGECIGVFSEDIREILEGEIEPALVISENQDIWVHFQAPDGFFMTMDGLDVISLPYSIDREGQSWLPPMKGNEYISLFQGQDFPLVPGYYVITIEGNDKVWYALIEVTPKFLGKQNWQTMKEELTKEIRHLSFDFMKQHIHIDKNLGNTLGIDSQMLLRFYIINDMFPVVMKSFCPVKDGLFVPISADAYRKFRVENKKVRLSNEELELLDALNEALQESRVSGGIGYRVAFDIDRYVENIPSLKDFTRGDGLDLQIVQRILTKVRGSREQLQTLLSMTDDGKVGGKLMDLFATYKNVSSFTESKKVLMRKAKELKLYDYTI